MYTEKCRIRDLLLTPTGECAVTIILPTSFLKEYDGYRETDLRLKLCKWRNIRSLKANNYSWKLTDELADRLIVAGVKLSKEQTHAEMIFRYGQPLTDENGVPVIYSTAQDVKLPEFYPYAKEIGESELNGKTFKHYRIYRSSHTYDSKEMSIFISGIVEECKEQGINTDTPEIRALLEGN